MSSIFTKMIHREIPAEIVYEDEEIIAIKDIYPKAPVHLLVIPKEEFSTLQSVPIEKLPMISKVMEVIQKLAVEFKIDDGYRVVLNNGKSAGQSVSHVHFHLLGGTQLKGMG